MTCEFESVLTGSQNQKTPVDTAIDTSKSDADNLDDHVNDIATSPALSDAQSIKTEWPGGSAPVVTTRAPGESDRSFLDSHKANVASALAADPIDC